jgi:hypothetical protein
LAPSVPVTSRIRKVQAVPDERELSPTVPSRPSGYGRDVQYSREEVEEL